MVEKRGTTMAVPWAPPNRHLKPKLFLKGKALFWEPRICDNLGHVQNITASKRWAPISSAKDLRKNMLSWNLERQDIFRISYQTTSAHLRITFCRCYVFHRGFNLVQVD